MNEHLHQFCLSVGWDSIVATVLLEPHYQKNTHNAEQLPKKTQELL